MKRKLIILLLLALALALMLTPVALAATAQAGVSPDTPESGSGHYHLTRVDGQVSSGGGYYLTGPASPDLTGGWLLLHVLALYRALNIQKVMGFAPEYRCKTHHEP